jgi:hypothetical protein
LDALIEIVTIQGDLSPNEFFTPPPRRSSPILIFHTPVGIVLFFAGKIEQIRQFVSTFITPSG